MTDTIVEEVREIRAAIAERFGNDRKRFLAWAREQSRQGTEQPSPKRVDANMRPATESTHEGD
jgi:hypothetical protein